VPTVTEVLPKWGSQKGGSRVAILGHGFKNTGNLCVKFGTTVVPGEFHEVFKKKKKSNFLTGIFLIFCTGMLCVGEHALKRSAPDGSCDHLFGRRSFLSCDAFDLLHIYTCNK
jgi:hypothetical protein